MKRKDKNGVCPFRSSVFCPVEIEDLVNDLSQGEDFSSQKIQSVLSEVEKRLSRPKYNRSIFLMRKISELQETIVKKICNDFKDT